MIPAEHIAVVLMLMAANFSLQPSYAETNTLAGNEQVTVTTTIRDYMLAGESITLLYLLSCDLSRFLHGLKFNYLVSPVPICTEDYLMMDSLKATSWH